MKIVIIFLLFFFYSGLVCGQSHFDTVYFDKQWKETTKDNSKYYRVLGPAQDGLRECRDYWKSGDLQMTGKVKSQNNETKEGEFIWYYKNGNVKRKIGYNNNEITSLIQEFDKNGSFIMEYVGNYELLDNKDKFDSKIVKYQKFIKKKLRYPEQARKKGVHGRVFVRFYIDKDGNISDLKIFKGIDELLDKEAKRVVGLYDKWPSPIYQGKKTNLKFIAPINFELN